MNSWTPHKSLLSGRSVFAVVLLITIGTASAEPFRNLNFEMAAIPINTPIATAVAASTALPYWTCGNSLGNYYSKVFYDAAALEGGWVSVHDSQSRTLQPLDGQFSAMLQDGIVGTGPPGGPPVITGDVWIAQAGDVPASAKSLLFTTDDGYNLDHLRVTLGGSLITMFLHSSHVPINGSKPVETYIGDVSSFAGRSDVELRFTKLVQNPLYPRPGSFDLDAIRFSSIVAPEPSAVALLSMGALVTSAYLVRRRIIR